MARRVEAGESGELKPRRREDVAEELLRELVVRHGARHVKLILAAVVLVFLQPSSLSSGAVLR